MNHKKLSKLLILFLILEIFACRSNQNAQQAKEKILREDLTRIREGIDKYFSDNQSYPPRLKELVRSGYLSKIPIDSITGHDDTWILEYEKPGQNPDPSAELGIRNVHSGAKGNALDGTPYSEL